jgi:hypothetical protein
MITRKWVHKSQLEEKQNDSIYFDYVEVYEAAEVEALKRDLQAQLAQAEKDWKAELDGTLALRKRFGAKDDETFPAFVERLAQDLAQAVKERDEFKRKYEAVKDDPDYQQCCDIRKRLEQENATLRQTVELMTGPSLPLQTEVVALRQRVGKLTKLIQGAVDEWDEQTPKDSMHVSMAFKRAFGLLRQGLE